MAQHTPTPWYASKVVEIDPGRPAKKVWPIFKQGGAYGHPAKAFNEADAAYIVRACNSHDELVAAVESLSAFVAIMVGRGADAVIPEAVDTPLGLPVKIGNIMRDADAAIARATGAA